ncbi:hypothetical protein C8046_07900 [Serinibacter arcticus]|uniref:Uncharacterized protein n=1 Tax=Serinibacter arcticus TaxID=1655435 RepID=A0A2U1ZUD1_9MICO|nr:hypothetical protein [Serinibacter arcticus]PWD50585.1 hypothetical protein C8046_07900 [Serinibacter arcticus]
MTPVTGGGPGGSVGPAAPDLGRLGLPAQQRIDTGTAPISMTLRGHDQRGPDALELWGAGVPTLLGSPQGRHLASPLPVRALLPDRILEGFLGTPPPEAMTARVGRAVSELTNPAWWVRQVTSREENAHPLTLGETLWSVRTTRGRTFSFRRGESEIATMVKGRISATAELTPLDHLAVATLSLVAEETTITSAFAGEAGVEPLPQDPLAPTGGPRFPVGPDGAPAEQLHRCPHGDVWVSGRETADGGRTWTTTAWGPAVPTATVTVPLLGGRSGSARVTVHLSGATRTAELAPGGSPTAPGDAPETDRGLLGRARDAVAGRPATAVDLTLDGRTWSVLPQDRLTRTVTRGGTALASWWGPDLVVHEAADPLDTAIAVALHHAQI